LLAEDFAEDIERVVETAARTPTGTATTATRALKRRVTVAIVGGALLRVLQHFVASETFLNVSSASLLPGFLSG